ncbi:hypothetical protein B0H16DRAFT_1705204 [Mycena metata]|uniref:Uncharacterized protein n=1 Tax=Mycena metata TaxID=1033252 RepID=A0AAD7GMK1_9AGAR|nr:hypothetical protein B0H16DRAFT_1705204 [Mycena metata]
MLAAPVQRGVASKTRKEASRKLKKADAPPTTNPARPCLLRRVTLAHEVGPAYPSLLAPNTNDGAEEGRLGPPQHKIRLSSTPPTTLRPPRARRKDIQDEPRTLMMTTATSVARRAARTPPRHRRACRKPSTNAPKPKPKKETPECVGPNAQHDSDSDSSLSHGGATREWEGATPTFVQGKGKGVTMPSSLTRLQNTKHHRAKAEANKKRRTARWP